MNWKSWLTAGACLLAGIFGTLLWTSAGVEVAAAEQMRVLNSPTEPKRPSANQDLSQAMLRGIVREEVADAVERGLARAASAAPPATATTIAPATGPEQPALDDDTVEPTPGYTRASAYVAERLVRGSWTEADREELSSALDSMNDRERREIMGSVIRASNEGSLRVETNGPLF